MYLYCIHTHTHINLRYLLAISKKKKNRLENLYFLIANWEKVSMFGQIFNLKKKGYWDIIVIYLNNKQTQETVEYLKFLAYYKKKKKTWSGSNSHFSLISTVLFLLVFTTQYITSECLTIKSHKSVLDINGTSFFQMTISSYRKSLTKTPTNVLDSHGNYEMNSLRNEAINGPFNLPKCLKPARDCFSRDISWIWQITNKWCFLMRESNHSRRGIRPQRECFGRDVLRVTVAGKRRQRQLPTRKENTGTQQQFKSSRNPGKRLSSPEKDRKSRPVRALRSGSQSPSRS